MKYISESCSFCLKAVKNKNCLFEVKISIAHNCTLQINCIKNTLFANYFKSVSSTVSDLAPRDCISYMQSAHGITASYHRAYAEMRLLNKEKAQSDEQSFTLFEPWLNQMVLIQKGTKAEYSEKVYPSGARVFEYCALVPVVSYNAFKNTLPILTLDACHTKGKYRV
ncbi:hypothetical protein ENBRE01_2292 [Enteropsectra breve]|nr:hypothetical protein ENBRE01_2292 [Enteropsectra breve]